ncbi:hypothetical protein [Nonlabens ponticola]|uniref:Uncharacterized protein n=1 Tax=Nonlabens ponticola TaxID=2496866 RepID=A0A3S9MX67_9FLAO|nr:hypothetical protein [Nonlabens ponticola]AZQ43729.1 hypothetical protein EJ995_05610 [Nonlabens ponticola]
MVNSVAAQGIVSDWARDFEEVISAQNRITVHNYYIDEILDFERHVRSIDRLGLETNTVYLQFFSQINATLILELNGIPIPSIEVDTRVIKGNGFPDMIWYPIKIPEGETSAISKVSSVEYGSFETKLRHDRPMLYLKHVEGDWYLEHTTVFRLAPFFFTY